MEIKFDCNFEKKKYEKSQKNKEEKPVQIPLEPIEIQTLMKNGYCRIDGPFGAPSQGYNNYNNLILIASGVGATPFASILFDILSRLKDSKEIKVQEVDFYWVIRSYASSSWLIDLFKELMKFDQDKRLNFHLIFTCSQQKYDFRSFFLWHGLELLKKEKRDRVSPYCGNIYWGRPD